MSCVKKYDEVYDIDAELDEGLKDTIEERIEAMRDRGIMKYRVKTIRSGKMLECEIYPVFRHRIGWRKKPNQESTEKQKNLNNKNMKKKLIRLLNANFSESDIWITVGYRNGDLPPTLSAARKDVINYIRKLQRYCDSQGLDKLKYVYVIEMSDKGRIHIHIVMNFPDRDIAEQKWDKGEYPQARRLKPNDFGLEGLARYLGKEPKGGKSYGYSLNLYKSWEHATISDYRMTKRKAEKIACRRIDPKEYFEKIYKGFELKDINTYFSEWVSGCYIHVKMYKEGHKKLKLGGLTG